MFKNVDIGKLKLDVFNLYNGQEILHKDGAIQVVEPLKIDKQILVISKSIHLKLKHISHLTFDNAVEIIKLERESTERTKSIGWLRNDLINIKDVIFSSNSNGSMLYYHFTHINSEYPIESGTVFLKEMKSPIVDYLRSQGFATQYLSFTIDELVNYGIIQVNDAIYFGGKDFKLTNDIVNETQQQNNKKSMLETISNMADYIGLLSTNRFQTADHIFPNQKYNEVPTVAYPVDPKKLLIDTDKLSETCFQGWSDPMYCTSTEKCSICSSNKVAE